MFDASIDAAVKVVVPKVPGHHRQDRSTASPTHSCTGGDEYSHSLAQGLVSTAVAACCGALPHSATLLREDRLDATKWKKRRECKRVPDPGVQPMPYQKCWRPLAAIKSHRVQMSRTPRHYRRTPSPSQH